MELPLRVALAGSHITLTSQYPTTRIPFQHGTPQSTMDVMGRVSEYNQHPPYSLYTTILISPLLRCMTRHDIAGLIHRNIKVNSYQTQKLKNQILESVLNAQDHSLLQTRKTLEIQCQVKRNSSRDLQSHTRDGTCNRAIRSALGVLLLSYIHSLQIPLYHYSSTSQMPLQINR